MFIIFLLMSLFTWLMYKTLFDPAKNKQTRSSVSIIIFVMAFAHFGALFGWVSVVEMLIENDKRAEQEIFYSRVTSRVTSSEILRPEGHGSEFGDSLISYRVESSNGNISYPRRPVIRSDPRQTKNYMLIFAFLGLVISSVLSLRQKHAPPNGPEVE